MLDQIKDKADIVKTIDLADLKGGQGDSIIHTDILGG